MCLLVLVKFLPGYNTQVILPGPYIFSLSGESTCRPHMFPFFAMFPGNTRYTADSRLAQGNPRAFGRSYQDLHQTNIQI